LELANIQFIISAFPAVLTGCKDIFIAEPYVFHVLEKNKLLSEYNSVKVAPYMRQNKLDIIADSSFIDEKYEMYLPLLSQRLNKIHNTDFTQKFWKKYLGLGFVRYLTAFYDTYKVIDANFKPNIHFCKVLDSSSYFLPIDFEDNRQCFLNSDFGQEQILSIYFYNKYPNLFTTYYGTYLENVLSENPSEENNLSNNSAYLKKDFKSIIRDSRLYHFLRYVRNILFRKNLAINKNKITIGIMGSFFSYTNLETLVHKSKNRITNINYDLRITDTKVGINLEERNHIAKAEDGFDEFDKFFFYSMKFCLPKICIEYFLDINESCKTIINNYPRLKYVTSEAWLSDSYLSILIAVLQDKGVKHIYNEHNCIFHPFEGKYVEHVAPLCDIYASVGWIDKKYENFKQLGSLFQYSIEGSFDKKYKILFVGVPLMVKMQHLSSAWGYAGENVPRNINFLQSFFSGLQLSTLNEISYRPYPPKHISHILSYDKEFILNKYIQNFKEFTNTDESSKIQMRQSELVVIDYISTSYLECLVMNIPFILFWDIEAYYLKDEYADFFTPLVNVGICQTNPAEAAKFVEKIKDNPAEWWFSESTQAGRKEFMDKNLGEPQVMIDYLLGLANT
jgi:putative transferase (TIGR04331 family)